MEEAGKAEAEEVRKGGRKGGEKIVKQIEGVPEA
jgi:hypothetical protein